ncbi:MAG: lipid-A-disaccharide synthase [Alphaproteobacteria bacterium]|nr:lipid-A-disaccharide synthase [Alphaproteobacteria bacterium]
MNSISKPSTPDPLIFLIAGEPSGDAIGGALMTAMKRKTGGRIRFAGIGGEAMQAEGLDSLFPMSELTLYDLGDVAARYWSLVKRLRETENTARSLHPAAIVTIDCPMFSLRVSRRLRDLGVPLIHYVAPRVYAYLPGRAAAMAKFLDHLLFLFPFEKPYFDAVGLESTYVGPNILERPDSPGDGPGFRRRHGIAEDARVLAVLPGSRNSELRLILPIFDAVIGRLAQEFPDLVIVAPTTTQMRKRVSDSASTWPAPTILATDIAEKRDAFAACDVALAAAGTVTLELAAAGVPAVVCGRIAALNLLRVFRGLRVKYISIPNWILDRAAIPEFRQYGCRPKAIAEAVGRLLADPAARATQSADLEEVVSRLRIGDKRPSDRAAERIMELVSDAKIALE